MERPDSTKWKSRRAKNEQNSSNLKFKFPSNAKHRQAVHYKALIFSSQIIF